MCFHVTHEEYLAAFEDVVVPTWFFVCCNTVNDGPLVDGSIAGPQQWIQQCSGQFPICRSVTIAEISAAKV